MSFCRCIDGSACSYPSASLDQLFQIILDIRRAPENPQKARINTNYMTETET